MKFIHSQDIAILMPAIPSRLSRGSVILAPPYSLNNHLLYLQKMSIHDFFYDVIELSLTYLLLFFE